jgi:hypothetical protein
MCSTDLGIVLEVEEGQLFPSLMRHHMFLMAAAAGTVAKRLRRDRILWR